ncbi:MAG: sulfotransferase [Symploca sp. SIO2E9]|nr:sulfotransferase [Symploca sp. SIO2E9]
MIMPNFLIIGAMKAGTTSMYQYLKQHPQIYMSPIKEPQFFPFEGRTLNFRGPGNQGAPLNSIAVTEIEAYRALFDQVSNQRAIGEASVIYLYMLNAAERIKYHIPDVRLIVILRNPADRAYSHFLSRVGWREPITNFAQVLREEKMRIANNWGPGWHYASMGFYYAQLRRYYDNFCSNQIKVYLYEDYMNSPISVLQETFQFLDVDDKFIPDLSKKHNVSTGVPRNKLLHRLLTKSHPVKSILKPLLSTGIRANLVNKIVKGVRSHNLGKYEFSLELRKQLSQLYREDILKLQDLIQKDLSKWLD